MYCFQCQETAKNQGCTQGGVCGKSPDTAVLQDLLIYLLKGLSFWAVKARALGAGEKGTDIFTAKALFMTLTNVNFDAGRIEEAIHEAIKRRESLKEACTGKVANPPEAALWKPEGGRESLLKKGETVGVLSTNHEDIRSLKELLVYGLKGIAAYTDHAYILGAENPEILYFLQEALAATLRNDIGADELVGLVLKAGNKAVEAMALLDKGNTGKYGNPEITEVFTGTYEGPAILVSGHDLLDFEEILEQTKGTGIKVYTHGEMLPAHAYPAFKKYPHLAGNYGSSWHNQQKEFPEFDGAIVMTTNCIQKPLDNYKDRIFTTGLVGWPGVAHIGDRPKGGRKDFSPVIAKAKELKGLKAKEGKKIPIGFAHNTVLSLAGTIIEKIKEGKIKRFIVMAGCDGRHKSREYFTEVASKLPDGTLILTAGCAKYRYNMLDLGTIDGIPRVLDAGQCNDSYSWAVVALKLAEAVGAAHPNDLPLSFDIGWYEQKAVAVLLALLSLGIKGIRLGPTLPAFLSPNVIKVLVEKFDIKPIDTPEKDIASMMAGH